jgi:hypothetical protein
MQMQARNHGLSAGDEWHAWYIMQPCGQIPWSDANRHLQITQDPFQLPDTQAARAQTFR